MEKEKVKTDHSAKGKTDAMVEDLAKPKPAGAGQIEGESIDRVRDILFGAHLRQNEQKFNRLEELLHKEISSLRDETKKTFDSLESYIKSDLESLTNQLNREQTERSETVDGLSGKLNDANKTLEKKNVELNERISKIQRELQEKILQQSKSLREEIRDQNEKLSASNEQTANELRNNKTDRVALANLFIEIAMRLKEEFQVPDVD